MVHQPVTRSRPALTGLVHPRVWQALSEFDSLRRSPGERPDWLDLAESGPSARHQAIRPNTRPRPTRGLAKEVAVELEIGVLEEGLLPAIAALRDVVGNAWNDDAGKAGHCSSRPSPLRLALNREDTSGGAVPIQRIWRIKRIINTKMTATPNANTPNAITRFPSPQDVLPGLQSPMASIDKI